MRQVPKRSKNTGFRDKLSLTLERQKLSRLQQGKILVSHWAPAASKCQSEYKMTRCLQFFCFFFTTKGKYSQFSSLASAKQLDAALNSNVADRQLPFRDTIEEKA